MRKTDQNQTRPLGQTDHQSGRDPGLALVRPGNHGDDAAPPEADPADEGGQSSPDLDDEVNATLGVDPPAPRAAESGRIVPRLHRGLHLG